MATWRCYSCRWWHTHYPFGACLYCHRTVPIGGQGACRLCLEQARLLRVADEPLDLTMVRRTGQQLFLANMNLVRRGPRQPPLDRPPARARPAAAQVVAPPIPWEQVALFTLDLDLDALRKLADAPDGDLLARCDPVLREHAARHGWSRRQINGIRRGLKFLEVLQTTPGAKVRATDVQAMREFGGTVNSTLDILAAAGLLTDDRDQPVERYFARRTEGLPAPMIDQLTIWLKVMLEGSRQAPRRLPRQPVTIRLNLNGMEPILRGWAEQGHRSLAEISREHIAEALPTRGANRQVAEQGLRSLFSILKARKQIFVNPMRGVPATPNNATIPLPVDTQKIRDALNHPDPASALAVALVVFHALTIVQIRALKLTDVSDGRLSLGDRTLPLAGPVLTRLAAWLDHRATTWPTTMNPHLLINRRSAPRTTPVGPRFPWVDLDVRPFALKQDRILQEIHATGGDIRRICDLFGMSVSGALRYVPNPEPESSDHPGS